MLNQFLSAVFVALSDCSEIGYYLTFIAPVVIIKKGQLLCQNTEKRSISDVDL